MHKLVERILDLEDDGIKLKTDGKKLTYQGPKEVINKEILDFLKSNKSEIIRLIIADNLLINENNNRNNVAFPLTDVQAAYMLGKEEVFKYGGVGCHIYIEIEYEHLNINKMQLVWNLLLKRHEMLRMQINEDKLQEISTDIPQNIVAYWKTEESADSTIEAIRQEFGCKQYDIHKAPLFDVGLIKRKNQNDIMILSVDLIIADWTSIWILIKEFEDVYFKNKHLPELHLSYRNYVHYLNGKKESLSFYRDYRFWINKIEKIPEAPKLPTYENNTVSSKFKHLTFFLDNRSWELIQKNAKKNGITATVAIMQAYVKVLRKWSENKDFSLNITMLNRDDLHPEIGSIVGDFTEISLLECFDLPEKDFAEGARNLQKQLFENLDHKLFSGIRVLREINKNKQTEKILMPYVYTSAIGMMSKTLENDYVGQMNKHGFSQTPQVFIDCQVMDDKSGLKLFWDVREGVFPAGLVEDMFSAFTVQISSMVNSDFWENENTIKIPNWQQKEREKSNDTEVQKEIYRLERVIFNVAKKSPEKIALIDKTKSYSYNDVLQYALYIRDLLIKSHVKEEDNIALLFDKSALYVMSALGVLCTGAAFIPIPKELPIERKKKIIESSGVSIALTDTPLLENLKLKDVIYIDKPQKKYKDEFTGTHNITDSAYIIYTSGSTGEPKGVEINHEAVMNTILDINDRFRISEKDVFLAVSKINFDLSIYDLFGSLVAGGTVVIPESDNVNPEKWIELIEKYKVTVWNSVPALMQILITHATSESKNRLTSLNRIFLSGDWIPVDLPTEIYNLLPHSMVVAMGGATEAAIWSVYHVCIPGELYINSVPYGKPLINQALYVLDSNLDDCPTGVKGDLYIGGKGLATRYINNPILTKEKFINWKGKRLYKTGDKAAYLKGGEIQFLGREDMQVKINGYRIELGEIEVVLKKYKPIYQAVVVVNRHKILVAAVSLYEGENITETKVINYLKSYLPQYMIPQRIIILKKIPLTLNGKIDRKEISNLIEQKESLVLEEESPNLFSDNDKKMLSDLLQMWREMLDNQSINEKDNLYNYGADSLIMAQMASKIRNTLSKNYGLEEITFDELLRELLNHPNIYTFFEYIKTYSRVHAIKSDNSEKCNEAIGTMTIFHENSSENLQILLHAGFGTMNCYRYLVEDLKKLDISTVAGIAIKNTEEYCKLESNHVIERLADEYVDLIIGLKKKKIQIIGYCVSGLIAVEIARRLKEEGIQVYDLTLVDSHPIHYKLQDDLLLEMMFLPSLGISMTQLDLEPITEQEFYAAVLYLYRKFNKKIPNNSQKYLDEKYIKLKHLLNKLGDLGKNKRFEMYSQKASEKASNSFPVDMCHKLFEAYKKSFEAASYEPDIYVGDIHFLLAEETSSFLPNNDEMTLKFWRNICLGILTVEKISGNHITCMENRDNAAILSCILSKCFNKNC